MVVLVYSMLATVMTFLSAAASGIIVIKLRHHWELSVSSVRWLFYMFFISLCLWATLRCAFFLWMLSAGTGRQVDPHLEKVLKTTKQLDSIAIHSIPLSNLAHNMYLAPLIVAGDIALLAVALWMIALTYELGKIAIMSMDRGPQLEAKRIRMYQWVIGSLIFAFGLAEFVVIFRVGGYTKATHTFLLTNLAVHIFGLLFMNGTLTFLKYRGRKYEAMHGVIMPSPVYERLKRIVIVYGVFASQYHVSSVIFSVSGARGRFMLAFMGVSMVAFTCTGLALSIITGCSQACVLQACQSCVPEDLEAQFMQHKLGVTTFVKVPMGPPDRNPVFVFTDIESSSALWALSEDGTMDQATNIHDDIMRSSLPRHNGYEITTCGDSFQLAFRTIKDAVSFCVDVQLQLLVAPWPKGLHGMVPATKKQRSGHRLVFHGLRVRMGIHDCVEADGPLVCARHAITGNMTYTGASEAIAEEVSELGYGGQILVTQRVAAWVRANERELNVDMKVERMGNYRMEMLKCDYDIYQILPAILAGRQKYWPLLNLSKPLRRPSSFTRPLSRPQSAGQLSRPRSFPEMIPPPPTPVNTPTHDDDEDELRYSLGTIPESPSGSDYFVPLKSA